MPKRRAKPASTSIKQLRSALKLTQAEFAREVGVDVITVSRWERGAHRPMRFFKRRLAEMATVFPGDRGKGKA